MSDDYGVCQRCGREAPSQGAEAEAALRALYRTGAREGEHLGDAALATLRTERLLLHVLAAQLIEVPDEYAQEQLDGMQEVLDASERAELERRLRWHEHAGRLALDDDDEEGDDPEP